MKTTFDQNNYVETNSQKQAKTINHNPEIKKEIENKTPAGVQKKSIKGVNKITTCRTCAERISADSSDEASMDTKEMTEKITSSEQDDMAEHIAHTSSNDDIKNRYMSMHISVCPECGKSYIKGAQNSKSATKDDPATQGSIFDASI